ncbi:T9SS type A sorting domain-containing protein, partial [candidate division KSB1 bacterium]|nr:T9SS type A sorting domain-containing protein [candidate division KSB1 bacterium]NIS24466.1 T9SS type A sorting domain-containing protein [candidate division KSB1 bacterium]NIU25086.1 T9SS type A sorting domain-containing protein [candidate division KSB1 bacterium]NIU90615.1 T9SS type A sorting domain-containing protein [candidate division KSB1 bacterium]NIV93677.1 T9SS type A sorting domain-containing protein [candidate division KSB1 bacterium]
MYQYISPRPGATLVSQETNIIVRFYDTITQNSSEMTAFFTVNGSVSGNHTGEITLADDRRSLMFKPHSAFEPAEVVRVTIAEKQNGEFSFHFTISRHRVEFDLGEHFLQQHGRFNRTQKTSVSNPADPNETRNDFNLPGDFPDISVTESMSPASGFIFLSNLSFQIEPPTVPYLMILDNSGFPVFFRRMPGSALDFKKQPNGLLTYFLAQKNKFYAMDASYTVVDSFMTGNGFVTDVHDLQILPNGHALLMSYDAQKIDMSQMVSGGDPEATVIGLIIQEIDASKNVVFQWRSWDHFEITDAKVDLTSDEVDYVHGNAIEPDFDGNILLSSRHMDEITKIDRQTGEIVWRLGGKNNQFEFINDTTGFSFQHSIRRLPNGHITLFDNGNSHEPPYSRAVEYRLDEENKTATLVWQFPDSPDIFGFAMGNVQRLPNGNTLIGWGATNPTVTEVQPDGTKAFELTYDRKNVVSYRAFRFPWQGVAAAPYLWADSSDQTITLNFVRFGATDVSKYYIYQGRNPHPTAKVDSTTETSIVITDVSETYYFRVTAVDAQGNESPFSNEIPVTVDFPTDVRSSEGQIPQEFVLQQNYPNPFNPTTTITYGLPVDAKVSIKIFNILGQLVKTLVDENQKAGIKSVTWQGTNDAGRSVASGVYLYQMRAGA